ncbi:ATP-dependent nuclease [Hyphococcus sp.]|jgi:predicted ATP-dependent endonuclease of OLD family|uniref:ATP-dependent nuclease n=1 Tax=Hyphococcus sp. TaxID=2038636 RepID=UPI003D11392D
MKIKQIKLQNFRCFENEVIRLDKYTALIGPNNAGKSVILQAINAFYAYVPKAIQITVDDFRTNTNQLRIEITWDDLSEAATDAFSHYVRQGELTLFLKAQKDENGKVSATLHGARLGIAEFAPFFAASTAGEKKEAYANIRNQFTDLPDLPPRSAAAVFEAALKTYETENPDRCSLIDSDANAFGATGPCALLKQFAEWVYIPAVKDASDEAEEAKNTAMGVLVNRIIRNRVNVEDRIDEIKTIAHEQITALSTAYKTEAATLENALNETFRSLTSVDATVGLDWTDIDDKSVAINPPLVKAIFRDDTYQGDVARFGHGLQRNYLLSLIMLNAKLVDQEAPSIIVGIEEPELFQHPPQAKHLYLALLEIARDDQVLVTTHSAYFISAENFELVRAVKKHEKSPSKVTFWTADEHRALIAAAKGEQPIAAQAALAALEAFIAPEVSEAFFCNKLVLVEGIEDRALVSEVLKAHDLHNEFIRKGGHIVPVGGKGGLVNIIAIARGLEIPYFAMLDGDTNCEEKAKKNNRELNETICNLLGIDAKLAWPDSNIFERNAIIWKTDFQACLAEEYPEWFNTVKAVVAETGWTYDRLKKNPAVLSAAFKRTVLSGNTPDSAKKLAAALAEFISKKV